MGLLDHDLPQAGKLTMLLRAEGLLGVEIQRACIAISPITAKPDPVANLEHLRRLQRRVGIRLPIQVGLRDIRFSRNGSEGQHEVHEQAIQLVNCE